MILVLADDMTGALEVGAVFAASGLRTAVVTDPLEAGLPPDVLIVDTETRHSSPSAAYGRIVHIVGAAAIRPEFIYKKTDSTLRGNIASELAALANLFPEWTIGYAPAYPAQGRTVRDGIVYVDGVPVSATGFAQDALNPVVTSSVRSLIGPDVPCTVFDGSNDSDVERAAHTILADTAMRIAAGPAALAAALAHLKRPNADPAVLPYVKSCILMNGSRTGQSQSQVLHAGRHQCFARDEGTPWFLLEPQTVPGQEPANVAAARAEQVLDRLRRHPADSVLIIGGDTAYAFVAALGSPPVASLAEVVPGVALSRINNSDLRRRLPEFDRDLFLITKAGGFGHVDVLCRIRQILEQDA
ncbi:MAG TPA: four-carbon acid sugar kinase family protein [Bryobacteraceae bacterium]|nr:four-carbon acid sugar kinase family protein [Bryobacteraceae bacterium]